jgi:hypothetical protein
MYRNTRNKTQQTRIQQAGSIWLAQQQFWLFGTATYRDGTEVGEDEAIRDARHYFNTIDKAILARKDYDQGRRLQRLVFLETGKQRINTHIHFYIKGTQLKQYRHIKAAAETLWTQRIAKAHSIVLLDNIEHNNERKGYCWKEFDCLESTILLLDCCHLAKPLYSKTARER